MTEQRTKPRLLSMLERMEEAARQAWQKNERIRHEAFVQALRDPGRAASTIADAARELARWESDTTRTSGEIGGWREVLAFPAEKIATLLEEQSHPLLNERNHESPFGPGPNDTEAEAFRQEMRERRRQPVEHMQGIRAMVHAQRQLSLVKRDEER